MTDMDAILDDALDALDDSDSGNDSGMDSDALESSRSKPQQSAVSEHPPIASTPKTTTDEKGRRRVPFGPPRPPPDTGGSTPSDAAVEDSLRKLVRGLADDEAKPGTAASTSASPPPPASEDEELLKMFQGLMASSGGKAGAPSGGVDGSKPPGGPSTPGSEEELLSNLFQGLMGGEAGNGGPQDMDEIPDLDNLFAGLGGGSGGGGEGPFAEPNGLNTDDFVDGMMEQLLSKELMYEPMKQVVEKFPAWLEAKQSELSEDEWNKRSKQHECFRRLVRAYEGDTSGQQTPKLLELMEEVQEYGQPPAEIIQEIAPGLELDEEGLPTRNSMPPFLGGTPGNEDCRIM
jgi:peroxin-19